MGYGGLMVGISVVAMFWVTDALDISGRSPAGQADSLGVASADKDGSCRKLRDAAKGVMQARQAGAARETVSEVLTPLGEDGEVMLVLAYGYPVHDAVIDKEQAIVEFADGIHSKCLSAVAP
ncbi:hypothetical protein A9Q88_13195 [Gammaproteobacteria bacterium 50_400_T64]|nr:hypothetical protein A9Q88_13195 [Gammaproteobacteria bacterium 50_400_T64]